MSRLDVVRPRAQMLLALASLAAAVAVAQTAVAAEIVVHNDDEPLGNTPLVPDVTGWIYAAQLTSPVSGNLVGVQIAWGSGSNTGALSQQTAIRVSAADFYSGPIYLPGSTLATIDAPVLADVGWNEFRYLDPGTNLVPLSVPVTAGVPFHIELETETFFDGMGVLHGGNLELWKNWVRLPYLEVPGTVWADALGFANLHNFGIRAIIEPVPEPSSLALLRLGMIGVVAVAWRRRRV